MKILYELSKHKYTPPSDQYDTTGALYGSLQHFYGFGEIGGDIVNDSLRTREEYKETLLRLIRQEQFDRGMSDRDFAHAIGMSEANYRKMIRGHMAHIDFYIVARVCMFTGRFFGEFLQEVNTDVVESARIMQKLPPSSQRAVAAIIRVEQAIYDHLEDKDDYVTELVMTGCMQDGMILDSSSCRPYNIKNYMRKYPNIDRSIYITSNHLHPVYIKGDHLLISCSSPRDGDTGIFVDTQQGRCYVRKLKQGSPCILEPVTPYGCEITVDPDDPQDMSRWVKFGVVLAKVRD